MLTCSVEKASNLESEKGVICFSPALHSYLDPACNFEQALVHFSHQKSGRVSQPTEDVDAIESEIRDLLSATIREPEETSPTHGNGFIRANTSSH